MRGQLQQVIVTTKGARRRATRSSPATARATSPTAPSTSRGAAGKRVWNVLDF